jgi:hypothetical protein
MGCTSAIRTHNLHFMDQACWACLQVEASNVAELEVAEAAILQLFRHAKTLNSLDIVFVAAEYFPPAGNHLTRGSTAGARFRKGWFAQKEEEEENRLRRCTPGPD